MDGEPLSYQLSDMIPAARFYSREEADAMAALAAEAGIAALVVNPGRATATFDMSLGAVGSAEGFTVFVNPADVEKLRAALERNLVIDPQDPLCTLSAAELRELLEAPLHANLTEQIIAAKVLTSRTGSGPDSLPLEKSTAGFVLDPHRDSDARLGRWLGGVAVCFTALYLFFVVLPAPEFVEYLMEEGLHGTWKRGSSANSHGYIDRDLFSGGVRVPLLCLLPFAASGALVFSRRKRADGTVRPMFTKAWRSVGWITLVVAAAGLFWILGGDELFWRLTAGDDPGSASDG